jgi:hypothetical protein
MGGVLHDDDAEPARACELVRLQQVPVLDPRTKAPPGLAAAGLERVEHRVDRGVPDGMHHRLVPGGVDTPERLRQVRPRVVQSPARGRIRKRLAHISAQRRPVEAHLPGHLMSPHGEVDAAGGRESTSASIRALERGRELIMA